MRNREGSCLFGEELVSYLYDELPSVKRHSFEVHLLDCSSCTAEFADLSVSRLGVYEWHRDEFAPLSTPHFAIPYTTPEPAVSWLDAIRAFIFTPARLSFAGGTLAILVAAFGALYLTNSNSNGLAGVQVPKPEQTAPKPPEGVKTSDEVAYDKYRGEKTLVDPSESPITISKTTAQKAVVVRAKGAVKRRTDGQLAARENRQTKAPRLGTFEEAEDKSLRLADLVADIDNYRK